MIYKASRILLLAAALLAWFAYGSACRGEEPSPTPIMQERAQISFDQEIGHVVFSPDGKTLAVAGRTRLGMLDGTSLEEIWSIIERTPLNGIAFSPDGRLLASTTDSSVVLIRRVTDGEPIQALGGLSGSGGGVAFSPDGNLLAVGSLRSIQLWRVVDWKPLVRLENHNNTVWGLAFSPDGKLLASTSSDQTVVLWRLNGGDAGEGVAASVMRTLRGSTYWVRSAAFSPDGKRIGAASGDGNAYLWDVTTGERLFTFTGQTGFVWSVAFSADGKTLASSSEDGSVLFWDTLSGVQRSALTGDRPVRSISFRTDGEFLAGGLADGRVLLWEGQRSSSGEGGTP